MNGSEGPEQGRRNGGMEEEEEMLDGSAKDLGSLLNRTQRPKEPALSYDSWIRAINGGVSGCR